MNIHSKRILDKSFRVQSHVESEKIKNLFFLWESKKFARPLSGSAISYLGVVITPFINLNLV